MRLHKRHLLLVPLLVVLAWGRFVSVEAEHHADAKIQTLRARGRELFFGRAGCTACHKLGDAGDRIRGPNLGVGDGMTVPVGARQRRPELHPLEYVCESVVDPDAYTVEGYARSVMRPPDQEPISLTDDEIVALAAFVAGEGDGAPRLDENALALCRTRIGLAREGRQARAKDLAETRLVARLPWHQASLPRGAERFTTAGCALCHESPDSGAPPLYDVGARLSREEIARWMLAPPPGGKMPSYARALAAGEVVDVATFLSQRRHE